MGLTAELPENEEGPPLVMVVDDHPDLREVLALILRHHGFRVMLASDGAEAVQQAESCRPDLVLMDLMMPRMNGYQATAALNGNRTPSVPVLAITASQVEREELERKGFAGLLKKPVRSQELIETIRRFTG